MEIIMSKNYDFSIEKRFTKIYKACENEPRAIREIRCMEEMYPGIFLDIKPGDKLAGRIKMSLIGFSPEPGGLGFYCDIPEILGMLEEYDYSEEEKKNFRFG